MKKILITGAKGFIGKNLKESLAGKYKILTPTHKQLDLLITPHVVNFFNKNKVDVVIHAAGVGGQRYFNNQGDIVAANLKMFFNLWKCQSFYKKMIFLGSGAEYDKSKPIVKIKETDFDKSIPADDYGFYKYICSKFIEKSDKILNLRLFGIFGKYEDYRIRFISNVICKMLLKLPITINQNAYFEYLYINDLVSIVDYFINNNTKFKFYNIGTGQPVDLVSLAEIILKTNKIKIPIRILKKGLNNEYTCNVDRLHMELKKFKYHSLEDSIRKLTLYYRSIVRNIKKNDLYEQFNKLP